MAANDMPVAGADFGAHCSGRYDHALLLLPARTVRLIHHPSNTRKPTCHLYTYLAKGCPVVLAAWE